MKSVQHNVKKDIKTVDAPQFSDVLDVSGMAPLSLAVQMLISNSDSPGTASAQLQGSIDGVTFFSVGSPVTITTDGSKIVLVDNVQYVKYRISYAIAFGAFDVVEQIMVYGEAA